MPRNIAYTQHISFLFRVMMERMDILVTKVPLDPTVPQVKLDSQAQLG